MLKSVEFVLEFPHGRKAHPSMGSIFHGALMEQLSSEAKERFHMQGARPYSQCVYYDNRRKCSVWRLGLLNREACEEILPPLMKVKSLLLRQQGYEVQLKEHRMCSENSAEELEEKYLKGEKLPRFYRLQLQTAACFRRQGQYIAFPELYLIVQSLMLRWNTLYPHSAVPGEREKAIALADCCQISKFEIRSESFQVERQSITGFIGSLQFKCLGDEGDKRLLGLLLAFAPFAGIGIKTALGMGANEIIIQV